MLRSRGTEHVSLIFNWPEELARVARSGAAERWAAGASADRPYPSKGKLEPLHGVIGLAERGMDEGGSIQ